MIAMQTLVAYFCHHLSDNYVDLSDLYVVLSDLYVDLSVIDVDLSDHYVVLSDLYDDLSDIMSTCQIILLLYVWHKLGRNTFLRFIF